MIALKREKQKKKQKPTAASKQETLLLYLKKTQQNKTPVVLNRPQNIRFLSTINNKKTKKFKKNKKLFGD